MLDACVLKPGVVFVRLFFLFLLIFAQPAFCGRSRLLLPEGNGNGGGNTHTHTLKPDAPVESNKCSVKRQSKGESREKKGKAKQSEGECKSKIKTPKANVLSR